MPRTALTCRGANLNRFVRVFAVPEDQAKLPPRSEAPIPAEVESRDAAVTEIQAPLGGALWRDVDSSSRRRFRWVLEDAWTRPDQVQSTLGGPFLIRQRPWPTTCGFGFVNAEGPKTLTDFGGVLGLNAACLGKTDNCWWDPLYLGIYEWGYSVTSNQSPGGSSYGFVAASQSIHNQVFDPAWFGAGFIDAGVLPGRALGNRALPGKQPQPQPVFTGLAPGLDSDLPRQATERGTPLPAAEPDRAARRRVARERLRAPRPTQARSVRLSPLSQAAERNDRPSRAAVPR